MDIIAANQELVKNARSLADENRMLTNFLIEHGLMLKFCKWNIEEETKQG